MLLILVALTIAVNIAKAAEPLELPVGDTKVFSLSFSADGKHLAVGTGGQKPSVKLFDVAAKKELLDLPCERRGAGFSVAFSPDGKRLAIADYDLAVTVRNSSDGSEVASLPGDPERKKYRQARRIAFLPDNQSLVVGYSTGEVYVWDTVNKQVTTKFDHGNEITAVAVSSDGRRIATGTGWGLRIWDAADGKAAVSLDQKSSGTHDVRAIAFLPDNKSVVTADSPGYVRFFAARDGKELRSFKMPSVGGSTTVHGLGVSVDGKFVVVPGLVAGQNPKRPQSLNEGILLLDVALARPHSFIATVPARVFALSSDGKTVAIATGDSGDPVFVYKLNTATTLKP